MILLYSAAMTLIVAATFGAPGYAVWASVWAVIVYRKASRPTGEATSPHKEKERFAPSSSSDSP